MSDTATDNVTDEKELSEGVEDGVVYPTEEEVSFNLTSKQNFAIKKLIKFVKKVATLRRIAGPVPWSSYLIAFVELCERFSYYGSTVVFTNFIQQPMPDGSTTGAGGDDGMYLLFIYVNNYI